jgi:sulfur carrier protein
LDVILNGEPKTIKTESSISDLIQLLALGEARIAVELNLEIVPRSEHSTTVLKDGDALEVVHAIGGG